MSSIPRYKTGACGRPFFLPRLAAAFLVGLTLATLRPAEAQPERAPADPGVQRQLDLLARVIVIVRERHVARPETNELIESALRGLILGIDPDAELLPPGERSTSLPDETVGATGLVVRREIAQRRRGTGGLRVIASANGSPAARAGLQTNDLITHVDDEPIANRSMREILALLAPRPGNERATRITMRRGDAGELREVLLLREPAVAGVETEMPDAGALVVRINRISATTGRELTQAVERAMAGANVRGVVLDVRNVASGSVVHATAIADAFLDAGPILVPRQRREGQGGGTVAAPGDVARGLPMVVLADGATAMAAEVVAASLQGNGRALIVGSRTFGRAFARQAFRFGDGTSRTRTALIPTVRFLTPKGGQIHGTGLEPDVPVVQARRDGSCRSSDIHDEAVEGCRPRGLSEDTQLAAALAELKRLSDRAAR